MIPGRPREDPLEKRMATRLVPCLENSLDRRAWWAIVHGVADRRAWWAVVHGVADRRAWWAVVHGVAKNWTLQSDFHSLTIAKSFLCISETNTAL